MLGPVVVKINNIPIQLGQPINPTNPIYSLDVQYIANVQVPEGQGKYVADWLWNLIEKCKADYITCQGVLILKSEVKKYKGS